MGRQWRKRVRAEHQNSAEASQGGGVVVGRGEGGEGSCIASLPRTRHRLIVFHLLVRIVSLWILASSSKLA